MRHMKKKRRTGYGLFLDMAEADRFCHAYARSRQIQTDGTDSAALRQIVVERLYCWLVDEGEIHHLPDNACAYHPDDGGRVQGILLLADHQEAPAPKAAYKNTRDMADEFRTVYAAWLPEGFDFEDHLVRLDGWFYPRAAKK